MDVSMKGYIFQRAKPGTIPVQFLRNRNRHDLPNLSKSFGAPWERARCTMRSETYPNGAVDKKIKCMWDRRRQER